MEFISGSTLGSHSPSTPLDIRHWKASSDQIIGINQLPESYTVLKVAYDPDDLRLVESSTFSNISVLSQHEDSHHFALEYSQIPIAHDSEDENASVSASVADLPSAKSISINATHYPFYPPLTTAPHRSTQGPILLKLGVDPDLVDIDLAIRPIPSTVVRGFAVGDHNVIARDGISLDKSAIVLGGDVTFHGETYSAGLKYTTDDHFVGMHALKSFSLRGIKESLLKVDASSADISASPAGGGGAIPVINLSSALSQSVGALLPTSIDAGMEYFIKPDDLMDTFTLGTLFTWHDASARHYRLRPSSLSPADTPADILTIPELPTSIYVHVNGIGTASAAYTSTLCNHVWRHEAARRRDLAVGQDTTITSPKVIDVTKELNSHGALEDATAVASDSSELGSKDADTTSIHPLSKATQGYNPLGFHPHPVERKTRSSQQSHSSLGAESGDHQQSLATGHHTGFNGLSFAPVADFLSSLCGVVHNTILHASLSLTSRFDYSIGSAESAFEAGLQGVLHMFSPNVMTTTTSTPNTSSATSSETGSSQPAGPGYGLSSTHVLRLLLSSIRGLSLDYTRLFSSSIVCRMSITKPLDGLLSPEHSRLHHSFPPIPALQQPIMTTEAYPMQHDVQYDPDYDAAHKPLLPWYPVDYTFQSHPSQGIPIAATHGDGGANISLDRTHYNLSPPSAYGSDSTCRVNSVNKDPITRRLSLCSNNGEWRSPTASGALPTPLWDLASGVTMSITMGYGDM